jgi:uncharacterized coiled-coil DUF342 family protein
MSDENGQQQSDPIIEQTRQSAIQALAAIEAKVTEAQAALDEAKNIKSQAEDERKSAEAAKSAAETALESAQQQLNEINALVPQVKTVRDDIKGYAEKAQTDSAQTAEIARTADEKDTRVTDYELKLKRLETQFADLGGLQEVTYCYF